MTIIVNLYGAPGSGKSTTRAGVFHQLKLAGVNCEECPEFAKKLTWTRRHGELAIQPYVFGKQMRDMQSLIGQVDVIVTDSPMLLSYYYGKRYPVPNLDESFFDFVVAQSRVMGGQNYYIERTKPYNPAGRNQTEDESNAVAHELRDMLDKFKFDYQSVKGDAFAAGLITEDVIRLLNKRKAA